MAGSRLTVQQPRTWIRHNLYQRATALGPLVDRIELLASAAQEVRAKLMSQLGEQSGILQQAKVRRSEGGEVDGLDGIEHPLLVQDAAL